ncbi:MAG: hypothetical protein ACI4EJ_09390 [Bacteroides sp.]
MEKENFIQRWRKDFEFRTISNSVLSFAVTVLFAVFNGVLGIKYGTVWNICICVYYCLLAVIRGLVSGGAIRYAESDISNRNRIHLVSSVILILLNISLVVPLALMVMNKKSVNMTMIPAISMAAYTTYKAVMASVNLRKARNTKDILVKELRNINFIDAIISILTIQNTLLVVKASADRQDMMILATVSSVAGLGVIIFITVWNLIRVQRR